MVNWAQRGYFGFTDFEPSSALSPGWGEWLAVLRQAVAGNFTRLPGLIDVARVADDPVLVQSCYYLLGDAGGADIASRVREEATAADDFEVMLGCCSAIAARSWLADVPLLLDLYARHAREPEADILRVYISDCVAPRPGELPEASMDDESLTGLRREVAQRYGQLAAQLGSAELPVFKARLYGVRPIAEWLLEQTKRPHFRLSWRRRFEAATGIDCSAFYAAGRFQPLAAAALVEEFLEGAEAAGYEDGVRYFFGHRIPD